MDRFMLVSVVLLDVLSWDLYLKGCLYINKIAIPTCTFQKNQYVVYNNANAKHGMKKAQIQRPKDQL